MSEPTLDNALALGVPLVGATAGRGQSTIPNYLSDKGKDIPILGNVAQPNFEAIGAAKPDLILVDGTSVNNNQPVLDALAKIAPTVYTGYPGGDWRENLRLTADALNMVEEAEYQPAGPSLTWASNAPRRKTGKAKDTRNQCRKKTSAISMPTIFSSAP